MLRFVELFLSFRGRVSPQVYLLATVGIFSLTTVVSWLAYTVGAPIIASLAQAIMNVSVLALGAKRLHDAARSGWWVVAGLAFILLVATIAMQHVVDRNGLDPADPVLAQRLQAEPGMLMPFFTATIIASVMVTMVLAALKRTPGDNRFGPPAPG
jgi:uncharacterized membrane protein YhaH (DUF805 family)